VVYRHDIGCRMETKHLACQLFSMRCEASESSKKPSIRIRHKIIYDNRYTIEQFNVDLKAECDQLIV